MNGSPTARRFAQLLTIGWLIFGLEASVHLANAQLGINPCEPSASPEDLITQYGLKPFQNPNAVVPTNPAAAYELSVEYVTVLVAGCQVNLRAYRSGTHAQYSLLVGDTIRARPGDTLFIRLKTIYRFSSASTRKIRLPRT